MEVSGQLCAQVNFSHRRVGHVTYWASELVWTLLQKKNLFLSENKKKMFSLPACSMSKWKQNIKP
jgi:hypothetical protein